MMRSGQSRCQRVRKLCSRYQRSTAANGPSVTVARERLRAAARRAAGGCAAKPSAKGATSIGLFVRQSKLLTWGVIERVCPAFPPPRAPHCALPTTTITLQYATYRTLFCISYQRSVIKNVSVLNPPVYFPSSLVSMFYRCFSMGGCTYPSVATRPTNSPGHDQPNLSQGASAGPRCTPP